MEFEMRTKKTTGAFMSTGDTTLESRAAMRLRRSSSTSLFKAWASAFCGWGSLSGNDQRNAGEATGNIDVP